MKLGFVSAILPDYTLEQVFRFARDAGFSSVELMCWPPGKAERRYAGVTHVDATDLSLDAIEKVQDLAAIQQVAISGLGYYPNPLSADAAESEIAVTHLRRVIDAAAGAGRGRGQLVRRPRPGPVGRRQLAAVPGGLAAADRRTPRTATCRIGIENCPMLFTRDEWPGGKNLATSPAIWRRMFEDIPSPNFGLNFDPSHFVWQQMDYLAPLAEFRTGSSTSTPRTPGSTAPRSTSTASWPIPSSGTRPRSPAWATSAGAPSSAP